MKRSVQVIYSISLVACLLALSPSYAAMDTVSGWYGYSGVSGSEEIYGSAINSESYSRIGVLENYDPGYWEDFWDLHLKSESQISNPQGTASSSSQTPNSVGATIGNGTVQLNMNEAIGSLAWTNTQSVYSSSTMKTVDVSFYGAAGFNLPVGFVGDLTVYFGVWENDVTAGNLMLDEKNGWTFSELDYVGNQFPLLQKTYTSSSSFSTHWSLDFQAGNDYRFFSYMVAEVVPEPGTILLLGIGTFFVHRRKK